MRKVLGDLAHELWAAAQLAPGEGISDGIARLSALLAQPAEGEWVVFGFDDRSVKVSQEAYSIFLARERHHLDALSAERTRADVAAADANDAERALAAVTAERDRLLSDNASLRGSCKALGEENKQLKRENKRQGRTLAAMAAKEA